jgi:apolipoprotein N-acyltransferase
MLAVGAGALHAAALAPVPRGALQVLALLLLVGVLDHAAAQRRTPWRAALLGWLFGVAWLAGTFWWLFISMHRYGHLPAWLAVLAVLALAGALAVIVALAAMLFVRWRTGRLAADVALWSGLWLGSELLRGQILTGFPWGASGYAHVDGLLAWFAPWVGVYGIGALAAAAAALGARLLPRRGAAQAQVGGWHGRTRAAMMVLPGLVLGLPSPAAVDFTAAAGSISVSLLQGNVAQDEKFDPQRLPQALSWHAQALLASRTDLVVAPETALPLLPEQLPGRLWSDLEQHFAASGRHALVGVPLGSGETGYTNSAVGFGPGGAGYRYDKHHLVPFGEFIPWGFRWFVDLMRMPLGDFSRGPLAAASLEMAGQRVAPNICFEDLFGEELAARFRDERQAPTLMVNLSNIGWFGPTVAVDQHLQISRLRALELQRPMLRATNTGATVIIDHLGRVTARLPPHRAGVLVGQVEARTGVTPFARWASRAGLLPLWGLAVLLVGSAVLAGRRDRARPQNHGSAAVDAMS